MGRRSYTLPDFIIIGANKAGTTSVANYLSQHPEVKISTVKEPMFFSSSPAVHSAGREDATLAKPYFAVTLDEYSSMFVSDPGQELVFGEASTSYLANPYSATLIKKIVPDVRLITILREPASRAISAYKMCYGSGLEQRSFAEVIDNLEGQANILKCHGVKEYVRNGLYSQLLQPYFNLFDRRHLLFLTYDDLSNTPRKVMSKILAFVGASPYEFDLSVKSNTEADYLNSPIEIQDGLVRRLRNFYQGDILATEKMCGLDLSTWMSA